MATALALLLLVVAAAATTCTSAAQLQVASSSLIDIGVDSGHPSSLCTDGRLDTYCMTANTTSLLPYIVFNFATNTFVDHIAIRVGDCDTNPCSDGLTEFVVAAAADVGGMADQYSSDWTQTPGYVTMVDQNTDYNPPSSINIGVGLSLYSLTIFSTSRGTLGMLEVQFYSTSDETHPVS